MTEILDQVLGLQSGPAALSWAQVAARTIAVFTFGVVLVRLAGRRFLGHSAGFDVLLTIMLGAVLSRAITGQAPFFKTLAASALLVLLHRAVGAIASRWSAFSKLAKGDAIVLVRNGQMDHEAMRRADISRDDLDGSLRLNGNVCQIADVAEARLERNGQISVVKHR